MVERGPISLAEPAVEIDRADLHFTAVRARGPGGQAVNKVSSAVHLRVSIAAIRGLGERARARLRRLAGRRLTAEDEIVLRCDVHRSQVRNREVCIERLRALVVQAAREPVRRRATAPSRSAVERRLAEKRRRAQTKHHRRDERSDE